MLAALLLTTSCGGRQERRAHTASNPAPVLAGVKLEGPIPGEAVSGVFRDETGRSVEDVHRLLDVGTGARRSVLLVGRRGHAPCLGAVPAADIQTIADWIKAGAKNN